MKTKLLILIIIGFYHIGNAQTKTCDTPDDDIIELNTISISKCNIEEKTVNRQKINKETNARYVRRKRTSSTSNKKTIETKVLLFSLVDKVPLFPKCYNGKDKNCFKNNFQKHFSNNFHPEKASEDGINGRVFIQFTINTNGRVSGIKIKGLEGAKNLSKEIYRVLYNLPEFIPGSHRGLPVAVTYSLPLNFENN